MDLQLIALIKFMMTGQEGGGKGRGRREEGLEGGRAGGAKRRGRGRGG